MQYETSSYELRHSPGLPSSPLANYCFALVVLSFKYSYIESYDYFSSPDPKNCCLHMDSAVVDCT